MRKILISSIAIAASVAAVSAHVTVRPREASAGRTETYTVRVPTEGQVATVSVDLDVPDGVIVTEVPPMDGVAVDVRRAVGRIVGITWRRDIGPGDSAEFIRGGESRHGNNRHVEGAPALRRRHHRGLDRHAW